MEREAAEDLHVPQPQAENAARGFAYERERVDDERLERPGVRGGEAELGGALAQRLVRERLEPGLTIGNRGHHPPVGVGGTARRHR